MHGVIINYRLGKHTQKGNYMVIRPEGVTSKEEAVKLIGKSAIWKTPAGREIKGKVTAAHGRNGSVRAIFEVGMPGQSVATKVEIK